MNSKNGAAKGRLALVCLLFCTVFAFAQTQVDTLTRALHQESTDSGRVTLYLKLAEAYQHTSIDSSVWYANRALDLAKEQDLKQYQLKGWNQLYHLYDRSKQFTKVITVCDQQIQLLTTLKDSTQLTESYRCKARAFLQRGVFDSALVNFELAIAIGEKVKAIAHLAKTHNNYGVLYIQQGKFDLGAEHLIQSLTYRKEANLKIEPGILLNIGVVSKEIGNNKAALEYFKEGLAVSRANKSRRLEGLSLQNIGAILTAMNRLDEAVDYLNQANEINLELNDSVSICKYYIGLGDIDRKRNDLDQSVTHYELAKQYFPSRGSSQQKMYIHLNLANAYYLKYEQGEFKDIRKIIRYAEVAYQIADAMGLLRNKSEAAILLFKFYSAKGDYARAAHYGNEHFLIRDTLFSQEKIAALNEVQAKYETEKKELEIELLEKDITIKNTNIEQAAAKEKQQTLLLIGVTVILGLSILFSMFLYRTNKQRQKTARELEENYTVIQQQAEEKEILLKEIHHRVKNNLQVISSLLDLQSQNITDDQALSAVSDGQARVKSMALIHQNLYQNEDIGRISFGDYVTQLSKQVSAIYGMNKKIEVSVHSGDIHLDIDTAIPLGLILNELITNSFKYAFTDASGQIEIQLQEEQEGNYTLKCSDNGVGLPQDFDLSKTTSLGLRLVRRLCKQLYGSVIYENKNGASFTVRFKDTDTRKAVQ